ncbi:MAG: hypothetical protein AB1489_29045 [Acidobacteriota bacterium]
MICRIDQLGVRPNKPRFFQNLSVSLAEKLTANLSLTWTGDKKELLAIISNKPANRARLRHYALRMQIEESFRDDKSGGFDLEHTRLQHIDRIERLLLAVAIATIWCHQLGERCIRKGDSLRRIIDPGRERQLSIFQLGLRLLHRFLAVAINLILDS